MSVRLFGVLVIVTLLVFAVPVAAVEGTASEAEPPPSMEEIRAANADNPVADDVLPQPAEAPSWTQWLYIPLTVVGLLMAFLLIIRYLQWQPRFAEERRSRRRR
jgi:4-amino-4-deoxy-L-arabinose transferase-like glycosyltransferase